MARWHVVHDADGENGEATLWALEVAPMKYVWIEQGMNGFGVCFEALEVCKVFRSFAAAKRWVSQNIRQTRRLSGGGL